MSKNFTILTALMAVCLVASNLFETKIFAAGGLTLTGGFLIFPFSYILNDCLSEVYGFKNAKFAILAAFAMNVFFVVMAQIVRILPAEDFWNGQEHFDYIFNADLRITFASMAAFLAGSIMNAGIMTKMRSRQGEKGFGWRAVISSLAGESLDSAVFFPIAFWGVGIKNLLVMMSIQIILKTLYEILILPITAHFVKHLKKVENLRVAGD